MSDVELIRCWQRGDASALAELLRRWQQPVARFLHHLTGGDQTADLCQEVFLRVCRAGATFRADGEFSTWLYRVAINVARDAGRRRRVRRDLGSQSNGNPAAAGLIPDSRGRTPDASFEEHERAEAVRAAVAELPEEQRLVLVLRHYQGVRFEEIARVTGTPVSTIKSRFAAALKRLRARLEQRGFGPEENSP